MTNGKKASGADTQRQELSVCRKDGKVWSHVRQKWLVETPEERVRQEYLCVLVNEYGYSLEQIDEEVSTSGRDRGKARADFEIWRTPEDKASGHTPLIVVECKADNVTIDSRTYHQGANYANYERAPFFITHNNRETKYWTFAFLTPDIAPSSRAGPPIRPW